MKQYRIYVQSDDARATFYIKANRWKFSEINFPSPPTVRFVALWKPLNIL